MCHRFLKSKVFWHTVSISIPLESISSTQHTFTHSTKLGKISSWELFIQADLIKLCTSSSCLDIVSHTCLMLKAGRYPTSCFQHNCVSLGIVAEFVLLSSEGLFPDMEQVQWGHMRLASLPKHHQVYTVFTKRWLYNYTRCKTSTRRHFLAVLGPTWATPHGPNWVRKCLRVLVFGWDPVPKNPFSTKRTKKQQPTINSKHLKPH